MSMVGFWRQMNADNRRALVQDWGSFNRVWYLAPQGAGGPFGGFAQPPAGVFSTFADLKPNLRSRDCIVLMGVLREQAVAPDDVFDVLVLGGANRPRQATSGGEPTGGGAYWTAPTSPTALTPLIELTRQGWTFQNICFNPTTSSAAVRLTRSASVDLIDAGHATFSECYFVGGGTGQIGIEDNGGSGFVLIDGCRFKLLTGTAILGLNTAAALTQEWQILNNSFNQNTNDIKMSLAWSRIQNNNFNTAGAGATNKVISTIAVAGQGNNNGVVDNYFNDAAAGVVATEGYSGSATDHWMNFATDAVKFGFV